MNKKAKRVLTRKEVSDMLGILPTNNTDLLEVILDVLMRATDKYPEINLAKLTNAMLELYDGYYTGEQSTDSFIKAKRYIQKTALGSYIVESIEDL